MRGNLYLFNLKLVIITNYKSIRYMWKVKKHQHNPQTTHIFMLNISLFYFCYLYKLYRLSISYLLWYVWCVYDNFVQMCWRFWQKEVGYISRKITQLKCSASIFFIKKSYSKIYKLIFIIHCTCYFKFKVHVHVKFLVHIQSETDSPHANLYWLLGLHVFYCMCKYHVYNNNYW